MLSLWMECMLMRVVEIYATPGAPRVVYRSDPKCPSCNKPATVGVYHKSDGGRSTELIYWCEEDAAQFDTPVQEVPSDFNGWFEDYYA